MDTTPKSAVEIFGDQLTALELFFSIDLPGNTPGERIDSLISLAKNQPEVTDALKAFLDNPLNFSTKFSDSGRVFEAIVRTLFATSTRAAIHSYGPRDAPKNQHWMPVAYLKAFGKSISSSKNNRSVRVTGVSFAGEFAMGFEIRDSNFIHPLVKNRGFYENNAEFFFCLIEGLYAQARACRDRPVDKCLMGLFFFVQSVRNPRRNGQFHHSTLSEIVDAALANMDAVGSGMVVDLRQTYLPMPFTPYVPPFVDRIAGARVYSLPIESKLLFSISTKPLTNEDWETVPGRYRDALLIQALRRGTHLFGITKDGALGSLRKLGFLR